ARPIAIKGTPIMVRIEPRLSFITCSLRWSPICFPAVLRAGPKHGLAGRPRMLRVRGKAGLLSRPGRQEKLTHRSGLNKAHRSGLNKVVPRSRLIQGGRTMTRRLALIFLVGGASLLIPAAAQGAVTIGSDLSPDPVNSGGCSPTTGTCTITNTTLPSAQ